MWMIDGEIKMQMEFNHLIYQMTTSIDQDYMSDDIWDRSMECIDGKDIAIGIWSQIK